MKKAPKNAGVRLDAFRQGDIAEGIAVQFIRLFAAVAQVRREEDVGIDAVATLLHRSKEGRCTVLRAGQAFGLQIKSGSSAEIPLHQANFTWFMKQKTPYFVALVDLTNLVVRIFPPFNIYESLAFNGGAESWPVSSILVAKNTGSPDPTTVDLGEPCVEISAATFGDETLRKTVFEALAAHVEAATQSVEMLRLGQYRSAHWQTNKGPNWTTRHRTVHSSDPVDLGRLLGEMVGPVRALLSFGLFPDNRDILKPAMELAEAMRKRGNDPGVDEYAAKSR